MPIPPTSIETTPVATTMGSPSNPSLAGIPMMYMGPKNAREARVLVSWLPRLDLISSIPRWLTARSLVLPIEQLIASLQIPA